MNINRDNYEMYFLLYVDNELTAAEKLAVDHFVAENPDLKTELDLLLDTTIQPEVISFSGKADLFKKEPTPDMIQEDMLLHLDNELPAVLIPQLTQHIQSSETYKREWNILQQTKLDAAEKIIFHDKASLYRHESSRIISMRFWRVAVAAIFIIGLFVYIGITRFSKNDSLQNIAAKENGTIKRESNKATSTPANNQQQSSEEIIAKNNPAVVANDNNNIAYTKTGNANQAAKTTVDITMPGTDNNVAVAKEKNKLPSILNQQSANLVNNKTQNNIAATDNRQPKTPLENINNPKSNETASLAVQDNVQTLQNRKEDLKPEDKIVAQQNTKEPVTPLLDTDISTVKNDYAKTAVSNDVSDNSNNVLFVTEDKINRSKVNALFKKVKRVLARNANIKAGNSVKIAGFEIASR